MRFSLIAAIASFGSVMAQPVTRAVTDQQVTDGLKLLTDKARALQEPAQSITIINAPLIVIGQGPFPRIIVGHNDIVSTSTALISQFPGTEPFGDKCAAITTSFKEFVRVNQAYLNILIGKAGLLTQAPFIGQPMATSLRQVESVYDEISITLINLCESTATGLSADANSLGSTLDLAIQKYENLSV
ncbi:hypothetical protein B0T20DRAFT_464762 [Sordaria brevicollis]|uniref:Uncharacterized protein n=1 Tax=Sordaria brevicollis TaxID=83679 RepID=A0AAE0U3C0_SORBR|nr:hypothetical protein B0T20DRAFT_464762 [Sordaria brevicollis]